MLSRKGRGSMFQRFRHGLDIRAHNLEGIFICTVGRDRTKDSSNDFVAEVICTMNEVPREKHDPERQSSKQKYSQMTFVHSGVVATLTPWDPYACPIAACIHRRLIYFPIRPGSKVFTVDCPLMTLGHLSEVVGGSGQILAAIDESQWPEEVALNSFNQRYPQSNIFQCDGRLLDSADKYHRALGRLPYSCKLAFLMALHPRLGAESPARCLAEGPREKIVKRIFDFIDDSEVSDAHCLVIRHRPPCKGTLWSSQDIRDLVLMHINSFVRWIKPTPEGAAANASTVTEVKADQAATKDQESEKPQPAAPGLVPQATEASPAQEPAKQAAEASTAQEPATQAAEATTETANKEDDNPDNPVGDADQEPAADTLSEDKTASARPRVSFAGEDKAEGDASQQGSAKAEPKEVSSKEKIPEIPVAPPKEEKKEGTSEPLLAKDRSHKMKRTILLEVDLSCMMTSGEEQQEKSKVISDLVDALQMLPSGVKTGISALEHLLLPPYFPNHVVLLLRVKSHKSDKVKSTKKVTAKPKKPATEAKAVGEVNAADVKATEAKAAADPMQFFETSKIALVGSAAARSSRAASVRPAEPTPAPAAVQRNRSLPPDLQQSVITRATSLDRRAAVRVAPRDPSRGPSADPRGKAAAPGKKGGAAMKGERQRSLSRRRTATSPQRKAPAPKALGKGGIYPKVAPVGLTDRGPQGAWPGQSQLHSSSVPFEPQRAVPPNGAQQYWAAAAQRQGAAAADAWGRQGYEYMRGREQLAANRWNPAMGGAQHAEQQYGAYYQQSAPARQWAGYGAQQGCDPRGYQQQLYNQQGYGQVPQAVSGHLMQHDAYQQQQQMVPTGTWGNHYGQYQQVHGPPPPPPPPPQGHESYQAYTQQTYAREDPQQGRAAAPLQEPPQNMQSTQSAEYGRERPSQSMPSFEISMFRPPLQ